MITKKLAGIGLFASLAVTLPTVSAQAQSPRTFVSAAGTDNSTCSFAAPCRHFQAAVTATNLGGEVDALDPAGYGPITISHAITIEGRGWSYLTPPAGGTGITINAGPADAVSLNGLVINGAGIGAWGIVFNSGASLVIENCVARNLTSSGIGMQPAASARIAVSNTLVANNGVHGIYLQPSGTGTVSAVFNRVEAYSNGQEGIGIYGNDLSSGGSVKTTAVDSVAGFNNDGFFALGSSSFSNTVLYVYRSTTHGNVRSGIRGEQDATVTVSSSNLQSDGWAQSSGGCVESFGDNTIDTAAPCGVLGKN